MSLDLLFAPRRVAVIGRDGHGSTSAARVAARLADARAAAPDAAPDTASGAPAANEDAPDLVVIAGDPRDSLGAARAWLDRGARALVVVGDPRLASDDDRDAGDDAPDTSPDAALARACAERGALLVGPRSGGVAAPARGLAALDHDVPVRLGGLALATTGPSLFAAALRAADAHAVGLHEAIDLGGARGVDAAALVRRWARDPSARVIALSGLPSGPGLATAIRDATRHKPVLVCGPDAPLLATCGATAAATDDHLAALAAALGRAEPPPLAARRPARVAVLTTDAACGALAAAALTSHGLALARPSATTCAHIASEVHARADVGHPVDLLAVATPRHVRVAVDALAADDDVDAILVTPPDAGGDLPTDIGGKPLVHAAPRVGAEALATLAALARRRPALPSDPDTAPPEAPDADATAPVRAPLAQAILVAAHLTRRDRLAPDELRRALAAYGIAAAPAITVANPHAARRAAGQLGYPVDVVLRAADSPPIRAAALPTGDAVEAAIIRLFGEAASADPRLAFEIAPTAPRDAVNLAFAAHARLGHTLALTHDGRRAVTLLPVAPPVDDAPSPLDDPGVRAVATRAARLVTDLPEVARLDLTIATGPAGARVVDGALILDPAALR